MGMPIEEVSLPIFDFFAVEVEATLNKLPSVGDLNSVVSEAVLGVCYV